MNDTLGNTLITALSVLLSSSLTLYINNKSNRDLKYKEIITSKRIDWLNKIRNGFLDLVKEVKSYVKFYNEDIIYNNDEWIENYKNRLTQKIAEIDLKVIELLLCISPADIEIKNKLERLLANLYRLYEFKVEEIDSIAYSRERKLLEPIPDIQEIYGDLFLYLQLYLKNEWEKIKKESK